MKGEHRVIVLSEAEFNIATGWVVACPITTKIKGSPFEVQIPRGLKAVGCVVPAPLSAATEGGPGPRCSAMAYPRAFTC